MASKAIRAAQAAAAREQQRVRELAMRGEFFRETQQRAQRALVLEVSEDGWPEWAGVPAERREELRALGAVLRRAFDARRDFREKAERLAQRAAENAAAVAAGRSPWYRMAEVGAEFDAARAVYEARWESAVWTADMVGVLVPQLDERALTRRAAALAIRVEQTGPEVWHVRHGDDDLTFAGATAAVEAWAAAADVYKRVTGVL